MKLTFDKVIERLNNDRKVTADMVLAEALKRKVWLAANGSPGCLYDSSNICLTKQDAIYTCALIADTGEGPPKGLISNLKKYHCFSDGGYRYVIDCTTLRDVL